MQRSPLDKLTSWIAIERDLLKSRDVVKKEEIKAIAKKEGLIVTKGELHMDQAALEPSDPDPTTQETLATILEERGSHSTSETPRINGKLPKTGATVPRPGTPTAVSHKQPSTKGQRSELPRGNATSSSSDPRTKQRIHQRRASTRLTTRIPVQLRVGTQRLATIMMDRLIQPRILILVAKSAK